MPYDLSHHHHRSIRLKGYDYTRPGVYFITICTHGHAHWFGSVVDGEMQLNDAGRVADACWREIPFHFPHVVLDAFVIMPNHGVLWIVDDDAVRARHAVSLRQADTRGLIVSMIHKRCSTNIRRISNWGGSKGQRCCEAGFEKQGTADRALCALLPQEGKMGDLIVRTVLGFAFLMLVLAIALFVPAGSLGFWRAWVYLAVFAGCTILITAYLIKNDQELLAGRVKAGPVAEPQKSQKILQSLASLFFVSLFIVPGLDFRFGWSAVPPVVSLIADGFVALGFFAVFLVFRENSYTRATIEVSPDQRVITTGPYSMVRHPMYAGAMILLIFTPIALGSWVAIPLVIPLVLVIAARSLDEERFLRANLRGYAEYCQKVRYRLVPFVW